MKIDFYIYSMYGKNGASENTKFVMDNMDNQPSKFRTKN